MFSARIVAGCGRFGRRIEKQHRKRFEFQVGRVLFTCLQAQILKMCWCEGAAAWTWRYPRLFSHVAMQWDQCSSFSSGRCIHFPTSANGCVRFRLIDVGHGLVLPTEGFLTQAQDGHHMLRYIHCKIAGNTKRYLNAAACGLHILGEDSPTFCFHRVSC